MNDKLYVYSLENTRLHLTDYLFCFKDEYKLKGFKVFKVAYYGKDGVYNGCFVIGLSSLTYINILTTSAGDFKGYGDLPEITYEQALDLQNHITKDNVWINHSALTDNDIQELIDLVFINWDVE